MKELVEEMGRVEWCDLELKALRGSVVPERESNRLATTNTGGHSTSVHEILGRQLLHRNSDPPEQDKIRWQHKTGATTNGVPHSL